MSSEAIKLIESIENELRGGNIPGARSYLRTLNLAEVPRGQAEKLARLSRKLLLPNVGLKILFPIIHPENPKFTATPKEMLEYAIGLSYIGASREAFSVLSSLDAEKSPEVYLQRAFALFAQWNYKATLLPLEQYIRSAKISEQERFIGQVNLAGALVYERLHAQADALLEELHAHTIETKQNLYRANVLELWAQSAILQQRWTTGDRLLFEAQSAVKGLGSKFEFEIRKWRAILKIMKAENEGEVEEATEDLRKVRVEAKEKRLWECIRDCDHFEALALKSLPLAIHLYCGTPYESFQKRFLREFPKSLRLPAEYFYCFQPTHAPEMIMNVDTGEVTLPTPTGEIAVLPTKTELLPEAKVLLSLLASDFYHPFRLATIYEALCPGVPYNPFSGNERALMAVDELQEWFRANEIPLNIVENHGTYRLHSDAFLALKLPLKAISSGTRSFPKKSQI